MKGEKDIWEYFLERPIGFMVDRYVISADTGIPIDSVSSYASTLCRTGWLEGIKQNSKIPPGSYKRPRNKPVEDKNRIIERGQRRSSSEIARWADVAMWEAEPVDIHPSATVIAMTPDPLRVMAAAAEMYTGKTVRYPSQVSAAVAKKWLAEAEKSKLNAAMEFIDIHLLLAGVTRGFTHQLVRQRTAVYVQESTRFAVKTNAQLEVVPPPSIAALRDDDPKRVTWNGAVKAVADAYVGLINAGVPAEDARGLLPTNIATRVHYKTNLRNLVNEAGKRLCSQAQFEWKQVWYEILQAIRAYGPDEERWQQMAIANMFKPVCYMTGKCEFMGDLDRWCVIRDRVEAHHRAGDPPDSWSDIHPLEPLREGAARQAREG